MAVWSYWTSMNALYYLQHGKTSHYLCFMRIIFLEWYNNTLSMPGFNRVKPQSGDRGWICDDFTSSDCSEFTTMVIMSTNFKCSYILKFQILPILYYYFVFIIPTAYQRYIRRANLIFVLIYDAPVAVAIAHRLNIINYNECISCWRIQFCFISVVPKRITAERWNYHQIFAIAITRNCIIGMFKIFWLIFYIY